MSLLRTPLFALFAPMLSVPCLAQIRTGPISGSVYEEQRQSTYRRQALVGALVEVQAPIDTLHTTTDYNGNFHLRAVPSGEVRVKVSYLGYKTVERDSVHIAPRFGIAQPLRIRMEQELQAIEEVVVTGRLDLVSQRGDALVFNALAVRTMAGASTSSTTRPRPCSPRSSSSAIGSTTAIRCSFKRAIRR